MIKLASERKIKLSIVPSVLTKIAQTTSFSLNPNKVEDDNCGFSIELNEAIYRGLYPSEKCHRIVDNGESACMGFFEGMGYYPFVIGFDEGEYGTPSAELMDVLTKAMSNNAEYNDHINKAAQKLHEAAYTMNHNNVSACDYDTDGESIVFHIDDLVIRAERRTLFGYDMEVVTISDDSDSRFEEFTLICGTQPDMDLAIGNLGTMVSEFCMSEGAEDSSQISKEVLFRLEAVLTNSTYNAIF